MIYSYSHAKYLIFSPPDLILAIKPQDSAIRARCSRLKVSDLIMQETLPPLFRCHSPCGESGVLPVETGSFVKKGFCPYHHLNKLKVKTQIFS